MRDDGFPLCLVIQINVDHVILREVAEDGTTWGGLISGGRDNIQ
jgi:hypothetical protein